MTTVESRVEEIERKYDVPESVAVPDAGKLLGGPASGAADERLLDAVYVDTADLRLLRAGVTLRRRTGGGDAGWHLKLPAGRDSREELRRPLGRARSQPPADLAALVHVHTRGAALVPVAELTTRRRSWTRSDDSGAVMAELVEDTVTATVPGEDTPRTWREVEVELGAGGVADLLDEVEGHLRQAGLRRASAPSKLWRVLESRLDAERREPVRRDASAGVILAGYLEAHVRELRALDPLVRCDRPDAVHRLRVEARRLRSVLQAFGRILDRGRTAAVVEDLAWIAAELGPARDTEVLSARVVGLVARLPDDLAPDPLGAPLARRFDIRAAAARDRTVAALDSPRYLLLQERLDDLLAAPPFTARAGRPAADELPRAVSGAYRRFERRMVAVGRSATAAERDLALHAARKAAKRLRYATELTVPVVGRPAERLRRRLEAVQDLLGERQDTVVSRAVLREFAADVDGTTGFVCGLIHAAEESGAARAEARLPAAWRRLRRHRAVGWLRPTGAGPDRR